MVPHAGGTEAAGARGSDGPAALAPGGRARGGGAGASETARSPNSAASSQFVLAQRVKKVLDELRRTREILSPDELRARTGLDVASDDDLQREMAAHANIEQLADRFRYRPKTPGIHGREDLVRYLRQMSTVEGAGERGLVGVRTSALEDAYLGVEDDIKALHKEGIIMKFDHADKPSDAVLFYNERDPALGLGLRTSPGVVDLYFQTPASQHTKDLEAEVVAAGLKSMLANRPKLKKPATDEGSNRRKEKRRRLGGVAPAKATNAHMPELFFDTQRPAEIDRS